MSRLVDAELDHVLETALISPAFEIDGTTDEYAFLLEVDPEDGPVIERSEDGYFIRAIECFDEPAVVLFSPEGVTCGFYWRFQAWIDEAHRGLGFGVEMILAYADHFQDLAWDGELEASQGLGFSERGHSVHVTAQRIARIRDQGADPDAFDPVPAPAFC
ncbi:hypothetical protein [Salipiger mucosus]|uniref:Uncharacterized protein n=1 Tax=Salipiger mucosus DSM 16094 TaxID=1123237 RepID=S9QQ79_9RHOB|nr:hypothetical protein [Salipiger mucosus]EPX83551.1 hypothetical protein Salmuc_02159 [Salipiger mucosus DSM 16094]